MNDSQLGKHSPCPSGSFLERAPDRFLSRNLKKTRSFYRFLTGDGRSRSTKLCYTEPVLH